ncbi:MAG: SDR family oxidoreductase [Armatimonadetes bacterium]|nr:SDR family oxidoreductase [Armatimonadota bacterium]
MKILITGGAGFIGSHLAEHFQNEEVIVLDSLRSGFKKNLKNFRVNFVNGSVADFNLVNQLMLNVDYIFHLAALVSVPESVQKPKETVEINTLGVLNVLEAARVNKVKKIVLSSSSAVYGDNPVVPKKEDMLPEPKSPYAITKLDGEYYLKMYHQEYGLETVSLRYFNVFGPRQDPKSQYAAAIPIFVDKALKGEDLTIFGDGEQTRDFIFVKDVVGANLLALKPGISGIYNVGRGEKITINDLAKLILKLTNSNSKIVYSAPRAGDVKHSSADISKIKDAGFNPGMNKEDGLIETINFFKEIFNHISTH